MFVAHIFSQVVSNVILQRIVNGDKHIWELMKDLDADNCRYLHRVCALLVRKKSLPDGLVKHVMKAITNDGIKRVISHYSHFYISMFIRAAWCLDFAF